MENGRRRGKRKTSQEFVELFLHKKEEAEKPIASLPHELFLEVFVRLPVKSTFTCKCVSKTWLSIISNPDFVKLHLNHTLQINNISPRFILCGYDWMVNAVVMYITKHSLFSTDEFSDKAIVMLNHYPFKSATLGGILGCCNGLICLRHYEDATSTLFFSLWNPATKEYKRIPDSPHSIDVCSRRANFCYDCKNDDYKLVVLSAGTCRHTPSFPVYVYTSRSNSWKTIQTKPYSIDSLDGVLVNGSLHWIAQTPKVIVSFNINDESFKEIQPPGEIMDKLLYPYTTLKVLGGCLCIILLQLNKAWVMQEYGVWESCTKHENKIENKYENLRWSSENGECLIYGERNDLVLFYRKSSAVRPLSFGSRNVYNYVESLVSLSSGTYSGRTKVIGTRTRGIWKEKKEYKLVR